MVTKQRTYLCIDMKSFYASVECADLGLNPFETNLVVADNSRGNGAICLAVTPKLKSLGVKNRCRLYEIPKSIDYKIVMPHMRKYIERSADIYELYLDYFSPNDMHVYSVDEGFIDATNYLNKYGMPPKDLAKMLINEIANRLHIPATAGIGTNMYLAKIALDITAKKAPDHIGYLTEELFRETLWDHRPITDFWQIARGISNRLAKYGIHDMRGIANAPEDLMYRTFGVNAELLIDHAYGRESCTIADIKAYQSKSKSVSNSQILFEDYSYAKAQIVMLEMTLEGCQRMMREHVIATSVGFGVGYSKDTIPPTGGTMKMLETTNVFSIVRQYTERIFAETTVKSVPIRRLSIWFAVCDEGNEGYTLFTDQAAIQKEKGAEAAVLEIKKKFGKNAIVRAMDLQDGATAIKRNKLIGGHNSE